MKLLFSMKHHIMDKIKIIIPIRARALHKNSSRHSLGVQRFFMESPLVVIVWIATWWFGSLSVPRQRPYYWWGVAKD